MSDLIEFLIRDLRELSTYIWKWVKSLSFIEWCILLIITFFVYVMIYGESTNSYKNDMNQCIADGHKSYECRGILKGARNSR